MQREYAGTRGDGAGNCPFALKGERLDMSKQWLVSALVLARKAELVFLSLWYAFRVGKMGWREAQAGNAEKLADWLLQYIRSQAAREEVEMAGYVMHMDLN